jgi:hypothetical protein
MGKLCVKSSQVFDVKFKKEEILWKFSEEKRIFAGFEPKSQEKLKFR